MKPKKVNNLIGRFASLEEGEKTGINIYVFASNCPRWPWAARIGGRDSLGKTVHLAVDNALESYAKDLRAKDQD